MSFNSESNGGGQVGTGGGTDSIIGPEDTPIPCLADGMSVKVQQLNVQCFYSLIKIFVCMFVFSINSMQCIINSAATHFISSFL